MEDFVIGSAPLTVERLVSAAENAPRIVLAPETRDQVAAGRAVVDDILASDTPVYGVNTGVGSQKDHRVTAAEAADYNRRLLSGHGTRVPGPSAEAETVRATLIVLLHELASGHSGASVELVELVAARASEAEMPEIDVSGSVGASDLVPLAQLGVWLCEHPAARAHGLPKAKDALAMINCNALSLASGARCIAELDRLMRGFDLAAALAMEGFRANTDAISEPVNAAHRRPGQRKAAAQLRALLAGGALSRPGAARFLQDPLSFRNISQVTGAALECADRLRDVWNDELASTAINPLVALGPKPAYSHGNMDTTRMTLALDAMRLALAKLADVLGERVHKQQWPAFSGLPIGLAGEHSAIGGVQFLNLGHIASSLVTSVKIWAQPHVTLSPGQLADGVEDTASNALHAVHDFGRQIDACWKLAALEAAIGAWAIQRRGLGAGEIGAGLRPLFAALTGALPIGREGERPFEVAALITALRGAV